MKNVRSDNESTIDYYNQHAREFSDTTKDVAFTDVQDRFLSLLPLGALILDFGCGSGRDTKYFLKQGYHVDAIDGSEELCRIASDYTDIPVKHMYFEELSEIQKYDGIWACSSILHLNRSKLSEVLMKMEAAAKPGAVIYTSFKYGSHEGLRNGRYFTDFTEESFVDFLEEQHKGNKCIKTEIIEMWTTSDVRPGRSDEKWLNLILRKQDPS